MMNFYLLPALAAVFFFGVMVGDAGRNFFGRKVETENDDYDVMARDFIIVECAHERCEKKLAESRKQCGRLIRENAVFRLRSDGEFSDLDHPLEGVREKP